MQPDPETPRTSPPARTTASRADAWLGWVLAASQRIVVIPVIVLVLGALGAFVYGAGIFVNSVHEVIAHPLPVGHKIGLFLVVVDLFLIGATLLIAAIGFFELFIGRVEAVAKSRTPPWLQMHDLNDLKARVIAMIVLVATVDFVEVVVDAAGARQILELGGGVAVVIVALTAFLRLSGQGHGDS